MPIPDVWARPDRLRAFRVTTGGMADGLLLRRGALVEAVDAYRAATERPFEAEVARLDDEVGDLATTVRCLGEWVGRVGDGFADLAGWEGAAFGTLEGLNRVLPLELRSAPDGSGPETAGGGSGDDGLRSAGFTAAQAAVSGTGRADLRAVLAFLGGGGAVADGGRLGPALDVASAGASGFAEARHRWSSEPDRDPVERAVRAGIDGVVDGVASYAGSAAGADLAARGCGVVVPAAAPFCAPIGARIGGPVARRAAEWVTDRLLGDEPEQWERDPVSVADEIGDFDVEAVAESRGEVDDAAVAARDHADRHAQFVMDHPWLWDDDHPDAPHVEPPAPGPVQPAHGPA